MLAACFTQDFSGGAESVSAGLPSPRPRPPDLLPGSNRPHALPLQTEGTDVSYRPSNRPTIEAAFARESYRPGAVARLRIFSKHVRGASMRIFRAGTEQADVPGTRCGGRPSPRRRQLGTLVRGRTVWVPVPRRAERALLRAALSGKPRRLCAVRPAASKARGKPGRRGLADVELAGLQPARRRRRRRRRHLVREPQTKTTARLYRPYLDRGVPPNYKYYDEPFLRWLTLTEREVDYLAQTDVARAGGRKLAAA